jgi:hypothetical protein
MKIMKRGILLVIVLVTAQMESFAQCAMCRSTIENNYSNGDPGIAAGINTGILYLLCMPYLAIAIIAYLWYKSSKNASKKLSDSVTAG